MTKREFIDKLRASLKGLPQKDIEESLNFYSEMIDDRVEDGLSEEEAVFAVGSIEQISEQIIADVPFVKIAKEKIKPKRSFKTWEIVLIAVGFPIWLPLLIATVSIIFSLYVVLWSIAISVFAVLISVVACAVGGAFAGVVFMFSGSPLPGLAVIGASLFCAGFSILLSFTCKPITKANAYLVKKTMLAIKKCFVKKEDVA